MNATVSGIANPATYTLTNNPAITFSQTSLSPVSDNLPYNQTIVAQGGTGTKTLSLNGTFNEGGTGLGAPVLTANTATFNSTPTAPGTVSFVLKATDAAGATASQSFSLEVSSVDIVTLSVPDGTVYTLYSQVISADHAVGTTVTWSIVAGTLPDGLELDPDSGEINGIPTSTQNGTPFSFTVQAMDSRGGTTTQDLT